MTEYKSILLIRDDDKMHEEHSEILNEEFTDGWEYVNYVTQSVSTGASALYHTGVIVILKREKTTL